MGYESKVVIVDRIANTTASGGWVYGDEIARFDLCKMGYVRYDGKMFRELFNVPIDFNLYVNHADGDDVPPPEFYQEDCYGEHCKYTADIDGVIRWLDQSEQATPSRRAALFLDFLRVLQEHKGDYNQLCLVHYGY